MLEYKLKCENENLKLENCVKNSLNNAFHTKLNKKTKAVIEREHENLR
jgi:hypothetical protein